MGIKTGWYWIISWMVTSPLTLVVILISSLYEIFSKSPTYQGWNPATGQKDKLQYPVWAFCLIVFLALAASLSIPIVSLLYHFKLIKLDRIVLKETKSAQYHTTANTEIGFTESMQPLTNSN